MSQQPQEPRRSSPPEEPAERPEEPKKSYSTKARILAWIGVAFMVFLVIMYSYSLASGKIMEI